MALIMRTLQMGKNGLTKGFIEQTKKIFENANNVKIVILKSCCRDKDEAKKIAEELIKELGVNYSHKLVGYVITIRKWRKPQREVAPVA